MRIHATFESISKDISISLRYFFILFSKNLRPKSSFQKKKKQEDQFEIGMPYNSISPLNLRYFGRRMRAKGKYTARIEIRNYSKTILQKKLEAEFSAVKSATFEEINSGQGVNCEIIKQKFSKQGDCIVADISFRVQETNAVNCDPKVPRLFFRFQIQILEKESRKRVVYAHFFSHSFSKLQKHITRHIEKDEDGRRRIVGQQKSRKEDEKKKRKRDGEEESGDEEEDVEEEEEEDDDDNKEKQEEEQEQEEHDEVEDEEEQEKHDGEQEIKKIVTKYKDHPWIHLQGKEDEEKSSDEDSCVSASTSPKSAVSTQVLSSSSSVSIVLLSESPPLNDPDENIWGFFAKPIVPSRSDSPGFD